MKAPFGHTMGGALLVAGTSIGAGMLALPLVTAQGGFVPSLFLYALCWLFMTATGLLLAEIALKLPPDSNLVSMAATYLGRGGKAAAWLLYLFLFYCLSVAYCSGGGGLLLSALGLSLPGWVGPLLFVLALSPCVYAGTKIVDRFNWLLMTGLIGTYCALLLVGLPHVRFDALLSFDLSGIWVGLPVIFTAFSYQGVLPSLVTYLHRDPRRIRVAIWGGTTLAFCIYLLWEFLILGIVPLEGPGGLLAALAAGQTAVSPLKAQTGISTLTSIGQAFAFFAISTSYLGVTLGLFDFLADGLKVAKKGVQRVQLAILTFLPPLLISLYNPNLFLSALEWAGGFGCALLLGLLPTLLAWVSRRRQPSDLRLVPGGQPFLILLILFTLAELLVQVL